MATKIEKDKMRSFLRNLPDHIRKNVEVQEPQYPYALHISANPKIAEFIPVVSKRSLENEDRCVPRVCVAPTLWGCIVGYSSLMDDFNKEHGDDWMGGYVIYGLPYRLKLKPNSELLPDITQTDEEWLVGFDKAHRHIEPVKLGKVFAHRIAVTNTSAESRVYDITLYLEVNNVVSQPFPALPDHALEPGYWRLEVTGVDSHVYWDPSKITVHEMTKDEFLAKKKISAGMLSFEGYPPSTLWKS